MFYFWHAEFEGPERISKLKVQDLVLGTRDNDEIQKKKCPVVSKSLKNVLKIQMSQALKIQISGISPWETLIQVGLG